MSDKPIWQCACCESTSKGTEVKRAHKALICDYCAESLAGRGCDFCRKCKQVRSLPFGKSRGWCGACKTAERQARYTRGRERTLAQQCAYQEMNRAQQIARVRAYREANRDKIDARRRALRQARPEQYRATNRRWSARHRAWERQRSIAYYRAHPSEDRMRYIRRKLAILRGLR